MDTSNPSQPRGKRQALKEKSRATAPALHWVSLSAKPGTASFGAARGGVFVPNERGRALAACWRTLGEGHPSLETDAVAVTPHGLQGILGLSSKSADSLGLSEAVRLFKALSAARLARLGKATNGTGLWKKGYSERLIEGKAELAEARKALKPA